jgi:hypothetical protein
MDLVNALYEAFSQTTLRKYLHSRNRSFIAPYPWRAWT